MNSINNNLTAAQAANTLNDHYGRLATSVKRLSSGLRINSAADDAAGLAIRELMRADVAALNQGVRNVNDAISMLQTADAALGIIDEKLIRMKELAEQAATGTYNSTQRLMIHSEFVAMASEIDRIANATDFNGIKLLDGSLSGKHDGSGLVVRGAMKIHFGTANDSAEDYYYVEIGDCTTKGLGLTAASATAAQADPGIAVQADGARAGKPSVNDYKDQMVLNMPANGLMTMQDIFNNNQGTWGIGLTDKGYANNNFMFLIPAGTKNILINTTGGDGKPKMNALENDLQIFTRDGKHLAGTPLDDYVYDSTKFKFASIPAGYVNASTSLADNCAKMGFAAGDYDPAPLNSGPAQYDGTTLNYSTYNGMTIGYSGDPDRYENPPNNGIPGSWGDYELLTIDEATEDLVFWFPGYMSGCIKAYWDLPDDAIVPPFNPPPQDPSQPPGTNPPGTGPGQTESDEVISIRTQQQAQEALVTIDDAIVKKDTIRAHIGALQNRFENTVTNLIIQSENLLSSESRISDADVALEMTEFIRNQILTQSAVAMLGQANSYPHMLAGLIHS